MQTAPGRQSASAAANSRGLLAAVARMYYLDHLGQHEIADILGLSRSKVSRLLTEAREAGIVRISVADHDPRDRDLEERLVERFRLRQAVVVRTQARSPEAVRRTIGYYAAPAMAESIRPAMTVGVAGGRTLREVVRYLTPREWVRGISVVQLMGNVGPNATEIDALEISRVLAQRFDGTYFTVNAPAFVSSAETRDVFLAHEHNRLVWNLFGTLQLALVGIGSLDESVFAERGPLAPADLAELRASGAVGEVCGRFVDATGQECQTSLRDRVIGIGLDTLRRCPEVVGVTHGPGRATAAHAVLTGGLVTSLVIDERGAAALLDVLDKKEESRS